MLAGETARVGGLAPKGRSCAGIHARRGACEHGGFLCRPGDRHASVTEPGRPGHRRRPSTDTGARPDNPMRADWTIDQRWDDYAPEESGRWSIS
jgi:hypothetical protein